jgi:hypothetical protein
MEKTFPVNLKHSTTKVHAYYNKLNNLEMLE